MRQCGVHDDVMIGCHGNDAIGGNGCYESCNKALEGGAPVLPARWPGCRSADGSVCVCVCAQMAVF